MSMWVIRNAYVPAVTVTSIMNYFEGGDLPLNQDVQNTVASLPLDVNSPVVIADMIAASAALNVYTQAVAAAHLANQGNV